MTEKDKIERFTSFVDSIKKAKQANSASEIISDHVTEDFDLLCSELSILRTKVSASIFKETKELFEKKKDDIKISCFELMEHDFRENSHTNILQYLFDYRFSGDLGIKILKSFLKKINTQDSIFISSLLDKYTYFTEREVSIDMGRMDLVICDNESKFIIVIENKILSDIIRKESIDENNDSEISVTQLTLYKEHIYKKYKGYKSLLILLSYKKQNLLDADYVTLDYDFLYDVLSGIQNGNNVLEEYKSLLKAILKDNIDKISAMELGYRIFMNDKYLPSLYELETIKNIFYE